MRLFRGLIGAGCGSEGDVFEAGIEQGTLDADLVPVVSCVGDDRSAGADLGDQRRQVARLNAGIADIEAQDLAVLLPTCADMQRRGAGCGGGNGFGFADRDDAAGDGKE